MNFVSRLAGTTAPVRPFPARTILVEGMELGFIVGQKEAMEEAMVAVMNSLSRFTRAFIPVQCIY